MENIKNYSDFKVEDFVLDESFQGFCLGNDEEAKKFWINWQLANPNKQSEINKAKEIFSLVNGGTSSETFETGRSAFRNRLIKEGILSNESAKVVELSGQNNSKKGFSMFRVAAAALILLMFSVSLFLIFNKQSPGNTSISAAKETGVDIMPGSDKAILTLADGRQILIDSASDGAIADQNGIKVIKIGGQLTYDAENADAKVLYNTITTPKGGQYQLELADGSKIWLNAASSLRFPTTFAGKERTVELTGEGYFEVAHNKAMPFHVKVNDLDVEVLGTHFNINSYSDEPSLKTTLLEGSVKVKKNNNEVILHPGQQVVSNPGQANLEINPEVDVEEVVAWKNGDFLFNSANIETIMRQVARWYDVEVIYDGKINETASGGLPRSEKVSQVLGFLELTGKVHFEIRGRQIIVKPK